MDPNPTDTKQGNTGEWFLEAVGKSVEPAPPPVSLPPPDLPTDEEPSDATGDHAATEAAATEAAASTEAATVASDSTAEHVGEMWRAGGTQDPLEDWEPADLDRYVNRKRNFRWSVWVMVLLILGAVAAAILLSPRLVERQAASEAADYADVLIELRGNLPASQQVLKVLTEPETPTDTLSDLVPDLSRLQAAADSVVDAGVRPLPQPLPLIPSDALDDLEPSRDAMARLGADATALANRLADGISYRSLVDGFLDAGELPASAATPEITGIQERLALAFADASAVLGQLPGDPVFADHRAALSAAAEAHREWESAYIAALRRDDLETTEQLLDQRQRLLADLETSLVPALADLRTEMDAEILDLDRELAATINDLPD